MRRFSVLFPAKRPFSRKEPFTREKGSGRLVLPKIRSEDLCQYRSSKMVTRMVRRYDQDDRQSDASTHWDTRMPVLLKAFEKHGARDFSEKYWLRLIHEGSSKTRVEYCEDSKNSLACFQAIQGHSGGIPIDFELMEFVRIPYNWKKFIFHRTFNLSWRME